MSETDATQSEFLLQSKKRLAAFIESSTRFSITDIRFMSSVECMEYFDVEAAFTLDTVASTRDVVGVVHGREMDFETADWSLFEEKVKEALKAETNRTETLTELQEYILKKQYGEVRERILFREYPQNFFHSYACNTCHGHGEVTCGRCGGGGRTRCNFCSGSGTVQVLESKQVRDYSGHYRTESRYVSRSCTGCGGGGWVTCSGCGGTGNITCSSCSGHGYFTKITAIQTLVAPQYHALFGSTSPTYVKDAIENKAGLLNILNGYVKQLQMAVAIDEPQHLLRLTIHFQAPFGKLDVSALDVNTTSIIFGYNVTIFDTGHIIEKLVNGDFERLTEIDSFKYQISPSFHKQALTVLSNFMESEIHQEALRISSAQGHKIADTNEIYEALNRSLSVEYITQSLKGINKVARVVKGWLVTKYSLLASVLTIPGLLGTEWLFQHFSEGKYYVADAERLYLANGNAPNYGLISFYCLLATVFVFLIARWRYFRWLKKCGDIHLTQYVKAKKLAPALGVALWLAIPMFIVGNIFIEQQGIWVDKKGNLYGAIAYIDSQKIVVPQLTSTLTL